VAAGFEGDGLSSAAIMAFPVCDSDHKAVSGTGDAAAVMEGPAPLARLFEAQPAFEERAAGAAPLVERWAWDSSGTQHFESDRLPLMRELSGTHPPVLQDAPPPGGAHIAYGFDGGERCIVAEAHRPESSTERVLRRAEYIEHEADRRLLVRYERDYDWQLLSVRIQRFDGDDLILQESHDRFGGYSAVAYRYIAHRPVARIRYSWHADSPESIEEVIRDAAGAVTMVKAGDRVTWQRASGDQPATADDAVAALVAELGGAVEQFGAMSPWLVWLRHREDSPYWGDAGWPRLAVASQSDRARLVDRAAASDWRTAWDSLDWAADDEEPMPSAEAQALLDRLDGAVPIEQVGSVLRQVAQRLGDRAQPAAIYVAVDSDLQAIDEALAALPADQRHEVAQAGMDPAT
jgi:hypothetical protein